MMTRRFFLGSVFGTAVVLTLPIPKLLEKSFRLKPGVQMVSLKSIKVNMAHWEREDIPGVEELANSIRRHGLLNPIMIRDDYCLVDGRMRLKAVEFNGDEKIMCNVVSIGDTLDKLFG